MVPLCHHPNQRTVPAVVLLLFLVASIFKDVMNFRGLWLMVGMYLATSPPKFDRQSLLGQEVDFPDVTG